MWTQTIYRYVIYYGISPLRIRNRDSERQFSNRPILVAYTRGMDSYGDDQSIFFDEFEDTNNAKRANMLRAQLAIVDRAIDMIGRESGGMYVHSEELEAAHMTADPSSTGATLSRKPQQQRRRVAPIDGELDNSFKIDTLSSQLATCPQCLAEMPVKKMKSHVAHSCPNKLILCPELSCGCQLPLKHLRKHLLSECEITAKRRKLIAEAEERKRAEERRKADALEDARRQRLAESFSASSAAAAAADLPFSSSGPAPSTPPAVDFDDLESRYTVCPKCSESMRQSQLSHHLDKLCTRRRVMCPNYHTGCQQRLVPLYMLQEHLLSECAAEKQREAMIARSQHRQELVKCPACGQQLPLMNLRKHERELCSNRRVHCRNHPLGCNVMVRLKERAQHERVDGTRAERTALYLPGHGAHLAIREADIACPWTAEYWIYRPPAKESLKMHLRNAFLLIPKYAVAFAAEVQVKARVLQIVQLLHNSDGVNNAMAAADGGKLSKEQRAVRARELAQQRMDQVNALTALVPVYSDAVLAYTRAFQELAVSVEAGYSCSQEIIAASVALREPEAISLAVDYPGEVAAPPPTQFSFAGKGKGKAAKKGEEEEKKGAGKKPKRGGKRSGAGSVAGSSVADDSSTISGTSKASRASRGEHTDSAAEEGLSAEQAALDGMTSLSLADGTSQPGEGGSLAEGFEEGEEGWEEGDDGLDGLDDPDEGEEDWEMANGAEGEAGEESAAADGEEGAVEGTEEARTDGEDEGDGDAEGATGEAGAGTAEHSEAGSQTGSVHTKPKAAKKVRPLRVDWDGVFPYLYCGSALASMFQACLHAEHPHAYYEAARRHSATFAASEGAASADPLVLHPDLDLQYLMPPAPEPVEDNRAAAADSHGDQSADGNSFAGSASSNQAGSTATKHTHVVPSDSISFAVRALQAEGIAAFLADAVVAPKRSARDCALPVSAWHEVLRLLVRGLKTDFDALQAWRVESGLLKPDPAKAKGSRAKGNAEFLAKHEKAQEKKEKARLKREMKKQEKMMAAHGGGGDAGGAATATSEAAAASSASVASGSVSTTGKKDENLFKRAGDLLKAGCGAGLLAESSSRSAAAGEHNFTKICLSLGSGLSLLLPAAAPAQEQRPASRPGTGGKIGSAGGERPGSPGSPGRDARSAASAGSDAEEDGEGGDSHHGQHHGEEEEEEDHADHHYDLLMRPQDMSRLARSAGNIGIVAIPQTIGELTGMSDHQLQALDQQNAESDSADSSRPNSPTREGSPSMDAMRAGSKKHASKHKKRSKTGKKGAGGGAASKKASSLARLGMEARSFEVAVPRGRWTHLALVATAYPQNRLTLYMDGLLVKSLKDCAFPLPMSALGGATQSFESFEGAILDVRYWNVQRSSVEIMNQMHRLLELEKDGILGNNPRGLVAWWTFEDGGGSATVADVTGNRFKSMLVRRQLPATRPTADGAAGGTARAKSPPRSATPNAASHAAAVPQGESYFTSEEGARYRIPEEALRLLPPPYWKTLPPDCRPAPRAAWEQLDGEEDHISGPASVAASAAKAQVSCPPPWEAWMKTLPRWNWLNAETLPTPQLPASVRMALGKVAPKDPAKSVHHSSRGVLPIPSLRAKGVCAYELRRHRLATKGRELQREVDCPLGCAEKIKTVEVRFHVRFACVRRLVRCRFDYCPSTFAVENREAHERSDECQHMAARNRVLSLAELHTTVFPCSLCAEGVMQRDLERHEALECPHRLVRCQYPDCELYREPSIPAHALKHHLRFECASAIRREKSLLVERARARSQYPRPWGFTVDLDDGAGDSEPAPESVDMGTTQLS